MGLTLFSPNRLPLSPVALVFFVSSSVSNLWIHVKISSHTLGRRIGLNDQNVMPVSALANRYEVLPLVAQCESFMKVTRQLTRKIVPSSIRKCAVFPVRSLRTL